MARVFAEFKMKGFRSKKKAEEFAQSVNSKVRINHNYVGAGRYIVDYALKKRH